jgi:hypothetical protein
MHPIASSALRPSFTPALWPCFRHNTHSLFPIKTMELCERCKCFDIQSFSRNNYPIRGMPAAKVKKSAAEGCTFCSYLVQNIPELSREDLALRWLNPKHYSGLLAKIFAPLYLLVCFGLSILLESEWVLLRARRDAASDESDEIPLGITALEACFTGFPPSLGKRQLG